MISGSSIFIHVGQIHVDVAPQAISTVLGSCVAVCLYDATTHIGGMNHYLLPFWNNNGLQTPKFGNIAIPKLIDAVVAQGANPRALQAKIFGGASMQAMRDDTMMIGKKNILVAQEILREYRIPIVAQDIGGVNGRKIQFDLTQGKVLMKYALRAE
ncbi:MAG: chemotaxis protein CheD [Sulfuricurvum sp. PC08-66]|nr:MAG: chemotaxis protein CheD [Sulfuricurvum sp. PC08-66]